MNWLPLWPIAREEALDIVKQFSIAIAASTPVATLCFNLLRAFIAALLAARICSAN